MFKNIEGKNVPNVTFRVRQNNEWVNLTSEQLFKGKKVALFALPGAYTPTCSSSHLPRYNELVPAFKKAGVDAVYCLSVNDTFVMNEWQKDQKAFNVTMLPDGNGEFSEKMGLLVNKDNLGFGKRSWRYSMLVNDGKIEKMFIEQEKEGDPFEVSDADTMLKYLAPDNKLPDTVTIFTKPGCPYCKKAKDLLADKGYPYHEVEIGGSVTMTHLRGITCRTSVPQVFVGGKHVGGSEELQKFLK
jgi:glutathione-dependent peroxiredoxin